MLSALPASGAALFAAASASVAAMSEVIIGAEKYEIGHTKRGRRMDGEFQNTEEAIAKAFGLDAATRNKIAAFQSSLAVAASANRESH